MNQTSATFFFFYRMLLYIFFPHIFEQPKVTACAFRVAGIMQLSACYISVVNASACGLNEPANVCVDARSF